MTVGPHVYGGGRRGLWVQTNANLTDKLKHYLPRLRGAIPNLTDVFLPPTALKSNKDQVRAAGFFCHMYDVAHGRQPNVFADEALARFNAIGAGALELDFEGSAISDQNMSSYIEATVKRVRKSKPRLPLRINVVPFKGQFLPRELINSDPQLFVCAQAYGGNMEYLFAADEVKGNLIAWGILPEKANVMHAVMCAYRPGQERQVTLPQVRDKGAFYIDDLLLDAGLLV